MTPTTPADEYGSGCIFCDTCGESISIKDDTGFTIKHWEAHRNACPSRVDQLSPEPPNLKKTAEVSHRPRAAERIGRRAKRTEEERIDYLRSDPCVARFEAYRVLCASCDRWIRLRFNSTYCSVPWDAHRTRCLAKRAAKSFTYTLNDRSPTFSAHPSLEQFYSESPPVRPPKCPPALASSSSLPPPSASESPRMTVSQSPPPLHSGSGASTKLPNASPTVMAAGTFTSVIRVKDYPSSNHDSRRHKADQRAAALRADAMLGAVEPDRVFCRLCEKWVRLRQDSTYCAYPWRQHRSKCLLRHQKISDRVAAIAELRARRDAALVDELEVYDSDSRGIVEGNSGDGGSENGDRADCARGWRAERLRRAQTNAAAAPARLRQLELELEDSEEAPRRRRAGSASSSELANDDTRCDCMDVDIAPPPPRLAELDSPTGRLDFASRSVQHLFRTAYARSDELTIAALVVYLNAAMPPDKHEDFDTAEVTKMMRALHGRGAVVFEGDAIRMFS